MNDWTRVGPAGERPELGAVDADGRKIAVARLPDGSFAAFQDECTHEECALSEGDVEGEHVVCYCHSAEFDLRTGAVVNGPAEAPISVYETRVVDGEVEIRIT
jgi:3-phenylpropionate/trans-cinnamate dioxygenase ferredoxin subunit